MLQRPNEIKKHRLLLGIRSGLILIGVLLWQYMAMNGSYNPIFTSYPGKILEDLFIFFTSGELLKHASITIIEILGWQRYISQNYTVEGDWSQAAFWLTAGALSGPVSVAGLNKDSIRAIK